MATYEEIYGKRVKDFDSDPTLESSYEGQVWYDKSTGVLKSVVAFESVTSQTPLTTARYMLAGAGSTTAGLAFGGDGSPPITGATEEFNGSGWVNGGTMNNARQGLGGAGTQTAALGFGGYSTPSPTGSKNFSEEYDGTSWTEGNNLGGARYRLVGIGIQTAALACAGKGGTGPSPGAVETTVEQYNGTSWTSGTALSTARQSAGAAGTYTSGLICGGGATPTSPGGGTTNTGASEEWDGSSWTTGGTMPVTKRAFAGLNGLQTAAIMMGGAPNATTVQTYDGTSWATSPVTLTTARHGGAGTKGQPGTAGLAMGGYTPSNTTGSTEEYNLSINTITAAAFSSMGAMGTSRYGHSAAGDKTAAVVVSGRPPGPSPTTNVEEYNGSSWSEVTNVPSGKFYCGGGMGTQTASIFAGGYGSPPEGVLATAESYDGTNWTDIPSLGTGKFASCPAGTQTAGLLAGGSPANNTSEEWNGSSWSEGNNLTESLDDLTGAGTQTAAIAMGGASPPTFAHTDTELYDGTNWTNGPTMSQGRRRASAAGTQTDALVLAGLIPGPAATTKVEGYDGTSWSTRPSLGTSRYYGYGFSATSGNAYIAGGLTSPGAPNHTTAAEEFTGETETITSKTLTTS